MSERDRGKWDRLKLQQKAASSHATPKLRYPTKAQKRLNHLINLNNPPVKRGWWPGMYEK